MHGRPGLRMTLLAIVTLAGCAKLQTKSPIESAKDSIAHDLPSRKVGALGVIVSVASPQTRWTWAYGNADLKGTPLKADMQFRIASITKIFTTVAVLKLAEQGRLSTSDPISKYVPNPNPKGLPDWDKITIEELANNTAGLSPASIAAGSPAHWTPSQLLRVAREEWKPGAEFHYANMNFVALGELIKNFAGADTATFLKKEFFGRLKMHQTLFPNSGTDPPLVCRGYDADRDVTEEEPSWASFAGDMISSVPDLTVWIRALGSGKLLDPSSQRTLLQIVPPSTETGFGIEEYKGWIGHTGRIEGFSSACFYNPAIDASVVVMVNRKDLADGNTNSVAREIPILNDVIGAFFPDHPIGLNSG